MNQQSRPLQCELNQREKLLLQLVVEHYLRTAEPTPSQSIARLAEHHVRFKSLKDLSSATIRKTMALLEEYDYLQSLHTSSGRIPTPKAIRYYLDYLMPHTHIRTTDKEFLLQKIKMLSSHFPVKWHQLTEMISQLAQQVSLIVLPQIEQHILNHIEFVRLTKQHFIMVVVLRSGEIFHHQLQVDFDISGRELERMNHYAREFFIGKTLVEIKNLLTQDVMRERAHLDKIFHYAWLFGQLGLGKHATEWQKHPELFFNGMAQCVLQPDFGDVSRIRQLLQTLEEKTLLLQLLTCSPLRSEQIQVTLGIETSLPELKNFALVLAPYQIDNHVQGTIGLIGPIRMNYSRLIPLVAFSAHLLGQSVNLKNKEVLI